MKKIVEAITNGGAPLRLRDFKGTFSDEIWDAMQALLSGYDADTEGLIIQGCVVSGAGPYNLSAGIVYLNGEFMRIEAQTGLSLPQYIQPDSTVDTSRQFEDNSTQVLFQEKSATVDGSAPGAGQYVEITTTTDPDNRRVDSGWVIFTLNNVGPASYTAGARTPQYRVKNGVVHLRGIISSGGSPPAGDHAVTIGELPRPSQTQNLFGVNSAFTTIASFSINTSGIIHADSSVSWGGTVCLDGLSYLL